MITDYQDCSVKEVGVSGNVFLKESCRYDNMDWFRCHNSKDTLYSFSSVKMSQETCWEQVYDTLCPEDPNFYQACGHAGCTATALVGSDLGNGKGAQVLCETYLCHEKSGQEFIRAGAQSLQKNGCNGVSNCQNTDIDEHFKCAARNNNTETTHDRAEDENQQFYSCKDRSFQKLHLNRTCDDTCDCRFCDDENNCNGISYGVECQRKYNMGGYVDSYQICNVDASCMNNKDKEGCNSGMKCASVGGKSAEKQRNLAASQICAVPNSRIVCSDGMDQVNCLDSKRVALTCMVNNITANISIFGVCKGFNICDDGYDDRCEEIEAGCIVHKNQLCDEVANCPDGSDEAEDLCGSRSVLNCTRRVDLRPSYDRESNKRSLPILFDWVFDGVEDCDNGMDEKEHDENEHNEKEQFWKKCGTNYWTNFIDIDKDSQQECPLVLKCSDRSNYVKFTSLCDTVNSCGTENDMCSKARGQIALTKEIGVHSIRKNSEELKTFPRCKEGLNDFRHEAQIDCSGATKFTHIHSTVAQHMSSTELNVPNQTISCKYYYGEYYVYLSCSGRCSDASCPLKHVPVDTCINTDKRVYTITDQNELTVLFKEHGRYHDEIFPCKNKNCVLYKQVCDMVNDCGDWSDELDCSNHFVCQNKATAMTMVHLSALCDDVYDCTDYSDECDSQCPTSKRMILGNLALEIFSWMTGGLSVIFNTAAVWNSVNELKKTKTYPSLITWVMVLLISFSDLLMGSYLLTIAYLNRSYGTGYCKEKFHWLSASGCKGLGVVNTIASQVSLFSMTALSISRLITVSSRKTVADLARTTKSISKVALTAFAVILCSTVIALVPLAPALGDYFVNGLYYHENPLFTASVSKSTHYAVFGSYYGRYKTGPLTWKTIQRITETMFSDDQGGNFKSLNCFQNNLRGFEKPFCIFMTTFLINW